MAVDWRPAYAALGALGRAPTPDQTIHAARAAVDADPAAPLDLDGLAAMAGYSRFHFVRRFARVVGEPPGRYQTRKRMELARRLLETTDLSVTQICYRVGYASTGSFSAAFRQATGRPPTAWRRRTGALASLRAEVPPIPSCFVARHVSPSAAEAVADQVRNLGEAPVTAGS